MPIAPGLVGMLDKKNRQFLAKPARIWYCFSEMTIDPLALFTGAARLEAFGAKSRERLGNGAASH
jgi:hypothetical protein